MSGAASLAARVKARRNELGLAQGAIPGLHQSTLSKIEGGTLKDPSVALMTKLADGLRLGLEELATGQASGVRMIALGDIEADPDNPRTVDVAETVDAVFVESIRTLGLQQAITVRANPSPQLGMRPPWRVAMGGRRYAALVIIHGPTSRMLVPCKLTDAEGNDLLLRQLVENIQRADMNPADLAVAVTKLVDAGQDTQAIAAALKRGRRWVQEQASVGHHLTAASKHALRQGEITISQAVALAAERDEEKQNKLMARASLQALNEDEIRAIIAADREAEANLKAEQEAAAQPSLIEPEAPAKTTYPAANDVGDFDDRTFNHRLTWKGKHGRFQITLLQFGDHKWTAGYKTEWRPTTTRLDSGKTAAVPSRKQFVQQTAAIAFLDCARSLYPVMLDRTRGLPEDIPAMRELWTWVEAHLDSLGATARVVADWRYTIPMPELPRAKAAPAPKQAKPPKIKQLSKAEVLKLPAWGKPLQLAYFVVAEGGKLTLIRGWKAMATLLWQMYERSEPPQFWHSLRDRKTWSDDLEGKPFSFAEIATRITHLNARVARR